MKGRTTHSLRTPALATLCPILLLCTCPLSPAQERDEAAFVGDEITSLESIRGKSFKSL